MNNNIPNTTESTPDKVKISHFPWIISLIFVNTLMNLLNNLIWEQSTDFDTCSRISLSIGGKSRLNINSGRLYKKTITKKDKDIYKNVEIKLFVWIWNKKNRINWKKRKIVKKPNFAFGWKILKNFVSVGLFNEINWDSQVVSSKFSGLLEIIGNAHMYDVTCYLFEWIFLWH